MDTFFFIALPYISIIILLIGSLYRYYASPFSFSSLSTQFLEGKALHFGIRPFHWGVIFLFFGHLTAFLFPSAVLAWNGKTVRILIIEIAAFGFAIATLYGMLILIGRRLTNKRIYIVTSKMDIIVYLILFTQVLSGMWVAFFNNWGSVWFATTLTPYLRSLFTLSPDISAIIALPLSVKIHIISAFCLILILPFTRFAHFLVYPFRYLFRNTQRVIWNWDRKTIRKTTSMVNGVRAKNI
jgi:nitrate reductase gamma subunit